MPVDMTAESRSTVPFWFWNGEITKPEITRQLELAREGGRRGMAIHATRSCALGYLSDAWFEHVRHACAEARRLGLEIWIYDEQGCPSGTVGGQLWKQRPAYRQQIGLGINVIVPHGCFFSVKEGQKHFHPQSCFFQEPYYRYNAHIFRGVERSARLLARGRPDADVLILHPIRSVWMLMDGAMRDPDYRPATAETEHAERTVRHYTDLTADLALRLARAHVDFDFVPAGTVNAPRTACRRSALALPRRTRRMAVRGTWRVVPENDNILLLDYAQDASGRPHRFYAPAENRMPEGGQLRTVFRLPRKLPAATLYFEPYAIGDLALNGRPGFGDLAAHGYPFYWGTFRYELEFEARTPDTDDVFLRIPSADGVVEAVLNKTSAWRPPYRHGTCSQAFALASFGIFSRPEFHCAARARPGRRDNARQEE